LIDLAAARETFERSQDLTVGIEEELFCLDAEPLAPRPFPRDALDGARLKEELFASVVELNTGVHQTVAEATEELASLRARAKKAAAEAGLVLAAVIFTTWAEHSFGALSQERLTLLAATLKSVGAEVVGAQPFIGHVGGDDFVVICEPDQVESLRVDNIVSETARREGRTIQALGINPSALEAIVPEPTTTSSS